MYRLLLGRGKQLFGSSGSYQHHVLRAGHSFTRADAEAINKQLSWWQAKILTPAHTDNYKGLVLLSAGPIARYKALKQFSEPYLNEGFAAINMFHSKLDYGFCTPSQLKVNKLFNVLSRTLDPSCPIILKLYCSGSAAFLSAIAKKMIEPNCKLKLSGVIFDSGPSSTHYTVVLSAVKLFDEMGRYPTPLHKIRQAIVPMTLALINGKVKTRKMEEVMYSPFLHSVPQLYVYSLSDCCIDIQYIEDMIADQRRGGADVSVHTFPDTIHMLHRYKYPKEYDNLISRFLNKQTVYNPVV